MKGTNYFESLFKKTVFSRFGIKVGIAAGAVYYLKEQGVFRSSDEAHQVYGKIGNALQPYVQEVKKQLPIEVMFVYPKLAFLFRYLPSTVVFFCCRYQNCRVRIKCRIWRNFIGIRAWMQHFNVWVNCRRLWMFMLRKVLNRRNKIRKLESFLNRLVHHHQQRKNSWCVSCNLNYYE